MGNSTKVKNRIKPSKPYEGFPLFAHASGQWAKKIRGKLHYFGVWIDSGAALERLNLEYPYLIEGREPPPLDISTGCTLHQLCNAFLSLQEDRLNAEEVAPRTFQKYFRICELLLGHFGKDRLVTDLQSVDFQKFRAKLAERYGAASLRNAVNISRMIFNYAWKSNLIVTPVRYGAGFERPSAKSLRRVRNEGADKILTRDEVLQILDYLKFKPDPAMRAMVLLGVNCGFGNSDCASLPQKAVDLDAGWVEFPRVKTAIPRRIPLWPRTVDALREAIKVRPKAKNATDSHLCFLTAQRRPWVRCARVTRGQNAGDKPRFASTDTLATDFRKLLQHLEINGRRRLGFYAFRHIFETHAGESCDQVAVDAVMGHVDASMAANYRHGVSDERLRNVVDHVHGWLFGDTKTG